MADNPLDATREELEAAGIPYEVERGQRHFKVRFNLGGQNKLAVCSTTTSDRRAVANARQVIRRELRKAKEDEKD